MSLYTHWACFDCRKSFHYPPTIKDASGERKCPECGEAMCEMGIYFEPPPLRAKKTWTIMGLVSKSGYRFSTEGSKGFIDSFILTTKRPTLEGVGRRIELLKQHDEESKTKLRMKKNKEERKGRGRPAV